MTAQNGTPNNQDEQTFQSRKLTLDEARFLSFIRKLTDEDLGHVVEALDAEGLENRAVHIDRMSESGRALVMEALGIFTAPRKPKQPTPKTSQYFPWAVMIYSALLDEDLIKVDGNEYADFDNLKVGVEIITDLLAKLISCEPRYWNRL